MKTNEEFNFKKLFDSIELDNNYLRITEGVITEKMLSDKGIRFTKIDGITTGSADNIFVLEIKDEEVGLIELAKKICTEKPTVNIIPTNQNILIQNTSEPFSSMLLDNLKSLQSISFRYSKVMAISKESRFDESIINKNIIIPNGAINQDGNTIHNQDNPYSILNLIDYVSRNKISSYFMRVFMTICPKLITTEYFLVPEFEVKGILA